MSNIFNISASNCFVETLANKLLQDYEGKELELSDVLVLLPNRRACRSLAEAFVRLKGFCPTLLPQMRAIGDIAEDELVLSGANNAEEFLKLPQVIEPLERMMLFMKLIISRYKEFGLEKISLSQACYLAQELGGLIDSAALQNLSWQNLEKLVPDEYAVHWQETLKFLNIITAYWPKILKERGVIDSVERKNLLIEKQSVLWQKTEPKNKVIIAGTTAVSPSMKRLVKTVLSLSGGEVYLAGLDKYLDEDAWEKIDETHPQFELKQLLEFLQINRNEVKNLIPPLNVEREKFISEVLRPAVCSNEWRYLQNTITDKAIKGIGLVECDNSRIEALAISLLIRQAIETKETTVALVTPDRNLARRVAGELQRWNIAIDDSAGIPLMQTSWGVFMRLVIKAFTPNAEKHHLLALFKHKLFGAGINKNLLSAKIRNLEKIVWRSGLDNDECSDFLKDIENFAENFIKTFEKEKYSLETLLQIHIHLSEKLAATDDIAGKENLWKGEDGKIGAAFMAEWIAKAEVFGEIEVSEYLNLFEAMMSGIMVRNKKKSHPRVKILGPIEARLNHFDEIILGGFNEGVWPITPTSDPWMSRPMKKEFGFEQPEKQIGVLGLDFANLLGAKKVYLTRSKMVDGTPTIKSRWWMRLETVLKALNINKNLLQENLCYKIAEQLDTPLAFDEIKAPAPTPPVEKRPRKLSASSFEKLLRDPYSIYAEYILNLKPLDELNKEAGASDFGNIIHKILEDFGNKYPNEYPEKAKDILLEMGYKAFSESEFSEDKQAFWIPKYLKIVDWIVTNEKDYRHNITKIHNEVWGRFYIEDLPAGRFEIYAKADRIDETIDGKVNIIDYKTGKTRSVKEIKGGYAPQLPIEGLIAQKGGFDKIKKSDINDMMYWKLGDKIVHTENDTVNILAKTEERITEVLNLFDFETTPYYSRPNPKNAPEYSDYEHLARVKEWSVKEEGEDE